jgi:hypothetical protein
MKNLVFFVGDSHGKFGVFDALKKELDHDLPMVFLHVGDFGYWPLEINTWTKDFPWPVYFIDGNHEYFPWLVDLKEITEVKNNLFYVPRGTTMEFNGKQFGFMGGGFTPDYVVSERVDGKNWFPFDEEVKDNDIEKLMGAQIDVLVTHTPPTSIINRNFGPLNEAYWKLPHGTVDYSALRIEKLWANLGFPQMYCGHMHRVVQDGNCRILGINEVLGWLPL